MDISSEILETLDIMGNKNVIEVLKEGVTEQDIILESEVMEDAEEVEEIIEIIEEIVEEDESLSDNEISKNKDKTLSNIEKDKAKNKTDNEVTNKKIEVYGFDEENPMFMSSEKEETTKCISNNVQKSSSKKQVINYDVDEDWQDEELDRMEELDNTEQSVTEVQSQNVSKNNKKSVNNQNISIPLQSSRLDIKSHMDTMARSDKSRMDSSSISSVHNVEDNSNNHEIVKNTENNLLYTVLGTKKPDSSAKQQEKLNDSQYIKVGILMTHKKNIGNALISLR